MNRKIRINYYAIGIFLAIFFIMIALNSYTPYVADDFTNMYTKGDVRVSSIADVIYNQKGRYVGTNGRTVAHTIGALLLMLDKYLINFLNTIVFCLFIYFIYRFSRLNDYFGIDITSKKYKKLIAKNKYGRNLYKAFYILLSFLAIWYFTPVFGQNYLWVMGSANYLWTSVIILGIILFIREMAILKKTLESVPLTLFIIIFSFIAGWTNESSVPAMIVIVLYYLVKMKKENTRGIIYIVFMLVNMLVGFIVMITAPGNFVRMKYFREPGSLIEKLAFRYSNMSGRFIKYLLVLFMINLVFLIIARLFYIKKNMEPEVYCFAGFISYFSMILSPTFPPREAISSVIFFVISIIMCISVIGRVNIKVGTTILTICIILLGYNFSETFPEAILANSKYFDEFNARELVIIDNRTLNKVENIEVLPLKTDNKYVAAYGLEDCKENHNDWINSSLSRYYGVRSIILRKE